MDQYRPKLRAQDYRREADRLRRKLSRMAKELESCKSKQQWLEGALIAQRHARQVLEAAVSANYTENSRWIRSVVQTRIPQNSIILVVSKGDPELVQLEDRQAWHFPRANSGEYAGYYPVDSAEAVEHLEALIAQGAQYLLLPSTAFWWLEHYDAFAEHLQRRHVCLWRDGRCIIYQLDHETEFSSAQARETTSQSAPPQECGHLLPASPRRYDIVCFPIIDWGYRFQRPQQLLLQFAAAGHRIFYVSHQHRQSGPPFVLNQVADRIWEISLRGPRFTVDEGVLDESTCDTLFTSLKALQHDGSINRAVTIVQMPFWWPLVRKVTAAFAWPLAYDCLDHHAGFSTSHPFTNDQEQALCARAELVIASSPWLQTKIRRYHPRVLLVRNGCDYRHFAQVKFRKAGPKPVIGYYGAINEWFDSDLVADLAQRRPDWEFILIGSTLGATVNRLAHLPNVSMPGETPYRDIPGWLDRFDITILPFKRTPLTEAANPVKAYEILASGKPLVSVPLPEMQLLAPLVRLASTARQFEQEIQAELKQLNPSAFRRRRKFARANTWRQRYLLLAPALRKILSPSIVRARRMKTSAPLRNIKRSHEPRSH
jgi:glycosyltransferase involved in cell wall biosynthesis